MLILRIMGLLKHTGMISTEVQTLSILCKSAVKHSFVIAKLYFHFQKLIFFTISVTTRTSVNVFVSKYCD